MAFEYHVATAALLRKQLPRAEALLRITTTSIGASGGRPCSPW